MAIKDKPFEQASAVNILHLSDLHFGGDTQSDPVSDAGRWYSQLRDDLCNELGCERLHAAILSGDIGNLSEPQEYEAAKSFLEKLCTKFNLNVSQLIIVPGNHDLNWKLFKKGYKLLDTEDHEGPLKDGNFIRVSNDVIRSRDDPAYRLRFQHFSEFHETVSGSTYPIDPKSQVTFHHLPGINLLIVGFKSAFTGTFTRPMPACFGMI